jgi:hypothetical protein
MVGDTTLSREGKSQREAHKPEYPRGEICLRGDGIVNIPTGGIPRLQPWEDVKTSVGSGCPDPTHPGSPQQSNLPMDSNCELHN